MATMHTVTLRVVRADGEDHPSEWDWGTLVDSNYPVVVVSTEDGGKVFECPCCETDTEHVGSDDVCTNCGHVDRYKMTVD